MYIIQTKLGVCLGLGTVLEGLSLRDVAQERRGRGAVVVDLHKQGKNLNKSAWYIYCTLSIYGGQCYATYSVIP